MQRRFGSGVRMRLSGLLDWDEEMLSVILWTW